MCNNSSLVDKKLPSMSISGKFFKVYEKHFAKDSRGMLKNGEYTKNDQIQVNVAVDCLSFGG